MIYHGKTAVREVIVHCAATRPEWMQGRPMAEKVAEIRRWHVQGNGWRDIGYHWLIDRDGTIAPGRAENVAGAHVAGRNTGTIGVCLLGGHGSNENDAFGQHFTAAQDRALRGLIAQIKDRTDIQRITGHNQFAAKACPGFRVADWLAAQAQPAQPAPSTPAPSTNPLAALFRALAGFFTGRK